MALSILDGNQSATTLSTILSSGQHITAHTVVSLGTQAITDVRSAVSGSVVSISNFPATQPISGTVTANVSSQDLYGQQATTAGSFLRSALYYEDLLAGAGEFLRVNNDIGGGLPIRTVGTDLVNVSGTVTANVPDLALVVGEDQNTPNPAYGIQIGYISDISGTFVNVNDDPLSYQQLPIKGTVTIGSALPAGTNRIGVVTIGAGTVTIGAGTAQIGSVTASISGTVPISISSVTVGNSVTIGSLPLIAGTVTANVFGKDANSPATAQIPVISYDEGIVGAGSSYVVPVQVTNLGGQISEANPLPISGTVTASISNSVTIASFATSVTARLINPAGTAVTYAEVGTAGNPSIDVLSVQGVTSGTAIPISISSVTIGSLPAISGTVTANTFALQGTAVTTSNFTSTTASTVLANYNATREVLTIFNEGAGNLHICAGATCTTIAYQVRLSAGDYYEVPNHQTTITHSAVFATAGTARVTQVS